MQELVLCSADQLELGHCTMQTSVIASLVAGYFYTNTMIPKT